MPFKFLNKTKYSKELSHSTDDSPIDSQYNYWKIRIFYSIYMGYAFFYFSRKSFALSLEAIQFDLGFSKESLGWVCSATMGAYGISKMISGVISDKSNPRYFLSLGLMMTGMLNIFMGFCSSITSFVIVWSLNGIFQGFGFAPCARLITHWYSKSNRGKLWAIWSSSITFGSALIPIIVGYATEHLGWRYALYIPGALCIAMGLLLINRLRDTPGSMGLPSIEECEEGVSQEEKAKAIAINKMVAKMPMKKILMDYVLNNKWIWILGIAYFLVYFIRSGIECWIKSFLIQKKMYSESMTGFCVSALGIGGFAGSILSACMSDKLFKGRRGPTIAIFSALTLLSLTGFWIIPVVKDFSIFSGSWTINIHSSIFDSAFIAFMGFSYMGPQTLIGLFAVELSHKKAAGAATGFVGILSYMGAMLSGGPLVGKIIDQDPSWNTFIIMLIIAAAISIALVIPLWKISSYNKKE